MALILVPRGALTDIADAIRAQGGTADKIAPADMAGIVESMTAGGATDPGTRSADKTPVLVSDSVLAALCDAVRSKSDTTDRFGLRDIPSAIWSIKPADDGKVRFVDQAHAKGGKWSTDGDLLAAFSNGGTPDMSEWAVGDERSVTLTGDLAGTYTAVLMSADPYERATGETREPKFIWGLKELPNFTYHMRGDTVNSGGWPQTELRGYLDSKARDMLPEWLRAATKKVVVVSDSGVASSGQTGISTSEDYLFIPHEYEVMGNTTFGVNVANSRLRRWPHYVSSGNRSKKSNGSAVYWWTRTSRANSSNNFVDIRDSGVSYYSLPMYPFSVAISGCI